MTWYEALTFLMSFTLTLAVIFCLVGFGIWLHDRIVARRARKMSIDIPASNQGAWFYEANEATPIASFTAPSTRFTHVYIEDAFGSLTKYELLREPTSFIPFHD